MSLDSAKKKKLLKDLEVVRDNVILFNSLVTNKEKLLAGELFNRIEKMEGRLMKLPDVLNSQNEEFLYLYTMALIQDIENSMERYQDFIG